MMKHGKDITNFGDRERKIISDYNKLWHESLDGTWHKCYWMGIKVIKPPSDMWIYQELICKIRPSLIIETGTCFGGSALFMAHVCNLVGRGQVVTVDIKKCIERAHPRLTYLTGSSTSHRIVNEVHRRARDSKGPVMVILDSDHKKDHVLEELKAYASLVTLGSYLIVEDTSLNGNVRKDHGPGPREALEEWLPTNDRFQVDPGCEKYYNTFNPGGYLKCVR
jgi:cephalosporin hydroxylase